MSIVATEGNWGHQALSPQDPRWPVEVLRAEGTVTGNATGGVSAIQFNIRDVSAQLRKSSQVYALAGLSMEHDSTANVGIIVASSGFQLGGRTIARRWEFTDAALVGTRRIPSQGIAELRNILLGTPTASSSAALTFTKSNDEGIVLQAELTLFRFLPTVFRAGGPVFPQGQY